MTPILLHKMQVEPGKTFTVAAAFLFAFAFLPLPFGTMATVVLALAALIVAIQLVRRATPATIPVGTGFAVVACLLYFAVDALSLVAYPGQDQPWAPMVTSFQFLILPLLVMGFAQAAEPDPLRRFVQGARIGAILALALSVIDVLEGYYRPRGGMINPIPFGSTAALFAAISLIGAVEEGTRGRIMAGIGFTAGLAATFLSQSRSAWLAIPFFVIILLLYLKSKVGWRTVGAIFAGLAVLAVLAVAVAGSSIRARLEQTFVMFQVFELGTDDPRARSLDQRVLLWIYGAEAFTHRPLIGYGPQGAAEEVRELAALDDLEILPFNHLHNEFLTEAVGNGVVGLATLLLILAAPVVVALRSPRDRKRADRIAFATLLVTGAVIAGATGIAFGHDILNSIYVAALLVLCLSAARPPPIPKPG